MCTTKEFADLGELSRENLFNVCAVFSLLQFQIYRSICGCGPCLTFLHRCTLKLMRRPAPGSSPKALGDESRYPNACRIERLP